MKRFLLVILSIVFLCGSAYATAFKIGDAKVKVYASIREEASFQHTDRGDVPVGETDNVTHFNMRLSPLSRAGIKTQYGKIKACVEYGLKAESRTEADVSLRHAYFEYDMGGGNSLLVGQTWSVVGRSSPKQRLAKENHLRGAGDLYLHRNQQIRFTHKTDKMIFKVAIEDVDTSDVNKYVSLSGDYLVEDTTPALDASLTFKPSSNIIITPSGLVEKYKLKHNSIGAHDVNVLIWIGSLDGKIKTDLATLSFEGWYGQNVGLCAYKYFDKRPSKAVKSGIPIADQYGTDIRDVNSYGGWAQLEIPVKSIKLYIGGGYQQSQVRNQDDPVSGTYYGDNVSTWAAFINLKYNLTKGFYIQPEVAYYDWGDAAEKSITGNDLGSDLYAGVFFQYDFK